MADHQLNDGSSKTADILGKQRCLGISTQRPPRHRHTGRRCSAAPEICPGHFWAPPSSFRPSPIFPARISGRCRRGTHAERNTCGDGDEGGENKIRFVPLGLTTICCWVGGGADHRSGGIRSAVTCLANKEDGWVSVLHVLFHSSHSRTQFCIAIRTI